MAPNDYLSLPATKCLLETIDEYAARTGSSIENITIAARVDKMLPTRLRRGGCCTGAQAEKLEAIFDECPDGVTLHHSFGKTRQADEIQARRDEGPSRRARHIDRWKREHEAKYGQDNSDWVRGMMA